MKYIPKAQYSNQSSCHNQKIVRIYWFYLHSGMQQLNKFFKKLLFNLSF